MAGESFPGDSSAGRSGLAAQARKLLAPWFHERTFSPGSLLWQEGQSSGMLVAVRSGRVKIFRSLPSGRTVTLFIFGPDDVFGFLPFVDGEPYPASAEAMQEVTAEVMVRSDLLEAIRSRPEVAMTLFSLLGRRLRECFDRIENLSTPGVLPRVAAALHALVPGDAAVRSPIMLVLPVSSAEFAAAIGITPETLSRVVSRLVAAGILHRAGSRKLQVLDLPALERAAAAAGESKD